MAFLFGIGGTAQGDSLGKLPEMEGRQFSRCLNTFEFQALCRVHGSVEAGSSFSSGSPGHNGGGGALVGQLPSKGEIEVNSGSSVWIMVGTQRKPCGEVASEAGPLEERGFGHRELGKDHVKLVWCGEM